MGQRGCETALAPVRRAGTGTRAAHAAGGTGQPHLHHRAGPLDDYIRMVVRAWTTRFHLVSGPSTRSSDNGLAQARCVREEECLFIGQRRILGLILVCGEPVTEVEELHR